MAYAREIMSEQGAELDDTKEGHLALSPSPRNMSFGDRQKIAALVLFISPNENEEAAAGGNDIAVPQRWIVHDTVRGFRFQGIRQRLGRRLCTRVGDEVLRAATGCFHTLLPLLPRHGTVGKRLDVLFGVLGGVAVSWAKQREGLTVRSSCHEENCDPICHGSTPIDPCERSHPCRPNSESSFRQLRLSDVPRRLAANQRGARFCSRSLFLHGLGEGLLAGCVELLDT